MSELITALVFIVAGALAGGLTNSIAIWSLFHPYEPPRVGKRSLKMLQGAIPKSQERLASAIGRTVGTRLLTPEDLSATFSDESVRRPAAVLPFKFGVVMRVVFGCLQGLDVSHLRGHGAGHAADTLLG